MHLLYGRCNDFVFRVFPYLTSRVVGGCVCVCVRVFFFVDICQLPVERTIFCEPDSLLCFALFLPTSQESPLPSPATLRQRLRDFFKREPLSERESCRKAEQ